MKEHTDLSDLSDASIMINAVNMKVIVKKLDEVVDEKSFRHLIVNCFNNLVASLDHENMGIAAGAQVNLLAIALDNKLDLVEMIADASRMVEYFEDELKRRSNASSQTDRPAAE